MWRQTLAAAALLLAAVPVPAGAQTYTCGDVQLVFRNPDLQPGSDGFIRAQGQFFAQFQAIGDRAADIEVFALSFGPFTTEFGETACDTPVWFTGEAVINYRADRDPADGFFIPLVTPIVPDGTYMAAVHAYDSTETEIARFWAKAFVDNCDGPDGSTCRNDATQHVNQDRTAPWPMVLPGDGAALEGKTLSVEFGEPLSWFAVFLNGENITANMTAWEGRTWDADLVPDYGPYGIGGLVAQPCTLPIHTCMVYGPAYEWSGRALTDADVVRVEAADLAGNVGVKDIHIGSAVAGGAITAQVPILQWTVDRTQATVAAGERAVFRFTLENNGNAEGHPFAGAEAPPGWGVEWQPNHVPVGIGQRVTQELIVTPPVGAFGSSVVNATMTYQQGSASKVLAQRLEVVVTGAARPTDIATAQPDGSKDSPAPAAAAILVGLLAVAAVRWRRSGA